jgi:hypothetical protein
MAAQGSSVTRAALLRRGAAAAGLVVVGVPALVIAQSSERDVEVLNLLLKVEYAEAAFYAQAVDGGALEGELRSFAEQVLDHERQHLDLVKGVLGSAAEEEPTYDFGEAIRDADAFADASGRRRIQRPGGERLARGVRGSGADRLCRGAACRVDPQHRRARPGAGHHRRADDGGAGAGRAD